MPSIITINVRRFRLRIDADAASLPEAAAAIIIIIIITPVTTLVACRLTAQRCLDLESEAPKEPVPLPVRDPRLLTEPLKTPCSLSAVENPLVFGLDMLGVAVVAANVFLPLPLPMQMIDGSRLSLVRGGLGLALPDRAVAKW